jgi:hypothetical protein
MRLSVEKIYKIDKAGNANIERSWTLSNPNNEDIDLNEYGLLLIESIKTLTNLKVFDSNGNLEVFQEDKGDDIEILVKPRIKKLGSYQDYKITLQYIFPNFVHKFGDIWFFADTMIGIEEDPESPFPRRMDVKLQVFLPNLEKTFLQNSYHETYPNAIKNSGENNQIYKDNTVLEWQCSLSSRQRFQFQLFYGIRTNTKLVTFITTVATTIIVALIRLGFDILSKGVI